MTYGVREDFQEHNENLKKVLEQIQEAGLRLKPRKCRFACVEDEYLGHEMSGQGVSTDPKKIKAVRQYSPPTDMKSVRSFLGLASYYRRFVPGFARVASPLHALTKKGAFVWSPQCEERHNALDSWLSGMCYLQYW